MKKLLIIIISITFALGASAQYGHAMIVPRSVFVPRVTVMGGYSPFYPYYSPFYNPYYQPFYGRSHRPTKLDLKIDDIKNDYKERIWAAKHDTALTRKQRRQEVRKLKHERDNAINDARMTRERH